MFLSLTIQAARCTWKLILLLSKVIDPIQKRKIHSLHKQRYNTNKPQLRTDVEYSDFSIFPSMLHMCLTFSVLSKYPGVNFALRSSLVSFLAVLASARAYFVNEHTIFSYDKSHRNVYVSACVTLACAAFLTAFVNFLLSALEITEGSTPMLYFGIEYLYPFFSHSFKNFCGENSLSF